MNSYSHGDGRETRVTQEMYHQMQRHGYRSRIVSVRHIEDLRSEIEGRCDKGQFDEVFYSESLTDFVFEPPPDLSDPRSLIVAAAPQPQVRIHFSRGGRRVPLVVPPTYSPGTDGSIRSVLEHVLGSEGYRLAQAALPLKLLAVKSGLAFYGRNNITYVNGLGSFYRLAAFYSDIPPLEDSWTEHQVSPQCENCSACSHRCPTGAIAPDRFFLYAERCLTFLNERIGAFPDWLDPSSHNCLVGCLRCQTVCPMNRDVLDHVKDEIEFSEEETDLLLRGTPVDNLPCVISKKLDQIDMRRYLNVLERNLAVFIGRSC